jgi:hypothetical protein
MNIIGDFSYVSDNSNSDIRKQLFKPKGTLALTLAKRPLIFKIGDLIFCHAKLDIEHLNILKKYNKDIFYINEIWKKYLENEKILIEDKEIIDGVIIGPSGLLWNRKENDKALTSILFKELKISYMFLGHTSYDKIQLRDNQIWYCDTGISRAFGKNTYQYIDINKNIINIETISE